MKILLFSGSHGRHLYVHKKILENFDVCGVVVMRRENVSPVADPSWLKRDQELFNIHFKERLRVETETYGDLQAKDVFKDHKTLFVEPDELNSTKTLEFVKSCGSDLAFIFGVDLIKDPVMEALPSDKINLHLGLSPWYRGSATLFWPTYNLEPQFTGATIHQIVPEADAGAILHQLTPELKMGDGIHDISARTVVDSARDVVQLLKMKEQKKSCPQVEQRVTGRLYLTNHFHVTHLRQIYDLFENRVVDEYLKNRLIDRKPRLIKLF